MNKQQYPQAHLRPHYPHTSSLNYKYTAKVIQGSKLSAIK